MELIFKYERSYKNIFIYQIGYVRIKDSKYVKSSSVNPLYLIFSKGNGYFEGINKLSIYCQFLLMRTKKKLKNTKKYGVKSEI